MFAIEKRSIGTAIILSIITCGIYYYFWLYKVWSSLYKANNMPNSAGTDLVLSFITCGIYFIYMSYKAGKLEARAYAMHDLPHKDDSILYLVLDLLTAHFVSTIILQSNINNTLADAVNSNYTEANYGPGNFDQDHFN